MPFLSIRCSQRSGTALAFDGFENSQRVVSSARRRDGFTGDKHDAKTSGLCAVLYLFSNESFAQEQAIRCS